MMSKNRRAFEKRLAAARGPEHFDVAVDAQAAFSEGSLTWEEAQNVALRSILGLYEERQPQESPIIEGEI